MIFQHATFLIHESALQPRPILPKFFEGNKMSKQSNRSPIIQSRVREYLLITLISFAASVSLTRLFLELTGYPQLGGGELHIAHVLWGGLLLFIGTLLPLILTNRWALDLSAFLSGTGIGLFIDEVGKFITTSNDYFYPSAAPIIYAFFLLTVLLYLEFQKPKKTDARQSLYECFQDLEELLDNDLSIREHRHVMQKLEFAMQNASDPQQEILASMLKEYLQKREIILIPHKPTWYETLYYRYRVFENSWLNRQKFRLLLSFLLIIWGIYSFIEPFILLRAFNQPEKIALILENLISQNLVRNPSGLTWYQSQIGLEGSLGILAVIAGILLLTRKENAGVKLGLGVMLVMLTFANLLLFYFDQFSTILNAGFQFIIFLLLVRYRHKFQISTNAKQVISVQELDNEKN